MLITTRQTEHKWPHLTNEHTHWLPQFQNHHHINIEINVMCHDEQTKTRLFSYRKINMIYCKKQDRTCVLHSVHLDTAGRSALPQNVSTNFRELTVIHINLPLALQFAPKGRCTSFIKLLHLHGSRTSFLRIEVVGIPMFVGVVKVGLPHFRRHAVLRVHLVFDVFHLCQRKNASSAHHCQR